MSIAERGAAQGVDLKDPAGSGWMNPDWLRQDKMRAQAGSLADTPEGEWLKPGQIMSQTLELSRWYLGHTPEGPTVFGVVPPSLRSRQPGREGAIPLASTLAFDRAKERGFRWAVEQFYVLGYLSLDQARAQLGGQDPFEAVDELSDLPKLQSRKPIEEKLPLKTSGSDSVLVAVGTVALTAVISESARRWPKRDEMGRRYRLVQGVYTGATAVTVGGLLMSACMPQPETVAAPVGPEAAGQNPDNLLKFLELTVDQKQRLLEGVKDGKLRLASLEDGKRVDLPITGVLAFSELMPIDDEVYQQFQLTQYQLGPTPDKAIDQWTFVRKDGSAEAIWVVWVTEQSQLDRGGEMELTAWQLHLDVNGLASVEKGADGQPVVVGRMKIPADRARLAQLEIHPPQGKGFWQWQTDRFMNSVGQILALTAKDALAQESTATPEPSPTPQPTATAEPTATPNPEPEMLVEESHPLRQEAEGVRQSLLEHEVKGVTVGVEQVQDRQGNLVDLVVVRETATGNIVVHVEGWADKPDKWVVAETVEGTTQTSFIVDAEWAEIPQTLRLQPQEGTRWYVAYSDGSYFFTWRGQAEVVESDWSMKGLYAATRLKMPDKFERIIWVEPPNVDTSDAAVDVWIEEMLKKDEEGKFVHFTSSAGVSLSESYLRQALGHIKTMSPEERAFVLVYEGKVDFWSEGGDFSNYRGIFLDRGYLNYGFGPGTPYYLVAELLHEMIHTQQVKEHPACSSSYNDEYQSYYLANNRWLMRIGKGDWKWKQLLEEGSYPTCAD